MFRSSVVKASLGLLVMAGVLAVTDSGSGRVSWLSDAYAQPKPDIRNSKHNLSSGSSNVVKSALTSEICVYCHTPHGAGAEAPLWNRALPTGSYTAYSSETLDQTASSTIGGPSKLCLSCHDGTLAVGSVSNAPGSGTGNTSTSQIPTNLTDDKIALGSGGGAEGYTRLIGTNLKNDHPISVNFNNTIAGTDGELRTDAYNESSGAGATATDGKRIFNQRALGVARPHLVGFGTPNVQCPTCHDPHLASVTDSGALTGINNKFLRLNRFQLGTTSKSLSGYGDTTTDFPFDPAKDQVCTACHTRESKAWTESAHASSVVADEAYTSTAATLRQFPTNTKVWNAGCLNCHDTHTKTGARRLLREGVSGTNSAIENTCYQCHNTSGNSALGTTSGNTALRTESSATAVQVPDIATEYTRTVKMPIANATEVHEIRNADFEECPKTLGATVNNPPLTSALGTKCNALSAGTNANRHAECTDCHNPHRVRRGAKFYTTQVNGDTAVEKRRTHIPADDDPAITGTDGLLGNVISGALRGAWGVEPNHGTIDVNSVWLPSAAAPSFEVKRGDPGNSQTFTKSSTYLTREYQLCFKCHSNYAYDGSPPALGSAGTPASANSYNADNAAALYTNQAGEFAVYAKEFTVALSSLTGTHQCEFGGDTTCTPIGASWDVGANASTVNHRSWHPVMYPTGRTATERGGTNSNFRAPFTKLGIQTMHCSDCHGHNGTWDSTLTPPGPNLTMVQGPHGSTNNFLLRGSWASATNTPGSPGFCGNCHNPGGSSASASGWGGNSTMGHSGSSSLHTGKACGRCHVAVPHGWKNKAFMVNLNCVGQEGGTAAGVNCSDSVVGNTDQFTRGPYYVGAANRISTWRASRAWTETSCGPRDGGGGGDWMTNTC